MAKQRDIRRQIDQALAADSREYGIFRGTLTPWDFSFKPTKNFGNSRGAKIGRGDQVHFGAIESTNPDSLRSRLIDGVSVGRTPSRFPLEPDNWVLRLHTEGGLGRDNVWSHRMIVEHNHFAKNRDHRSTIWVDQEDSQIWAFSQDAFWITKRRASVAHDELDFDAAGFLKGVSGGKSTGKERGALALNISKQGGFAADTKRMGQLWHIFTFVPTKPTAVTTAVVNEDTNPKAKLKTEEEGLGGKAAAGADVGEKIKNQDPRQEAELCLRGDVKFKYNDIDIASFDPEVEPDTSPEDGEGEEIRPVFFYVKTNEVVDPDNKLDNLSDSSSNHKAIPRETKAAFKWYYKVDEETTSSYDASYHGVPPASDYYYEATRQGQATPPGDGGNPDGSPQEGPKTPTGDELRPSRQCQHGHSESQSQAFTQKFNVFPPDVDVTPVANFIYRKPPGKTRMNIEIMCKVSDALAAGEVIEMNVIVGEFKDDKGPEVISKAKFELTVASSTTIWTRFQLSFKGFQKAARKVTVLLARRTDITPHPTPEVWHLSNDVQWKPV